MSVIGQWLRPNPLDFGQFYMGGVVASRGAWDALYPVPLPSAWKNPGEPDTSTMRPRYAQLADERGVGDANRFMQLPPNALLYAPLSLVSYHAALVIWTGVMALFGWGVALQAARVYEMLAGGATRTGGVIVLAIACSPTMFRAARAGQVSTLVGFCIGATALGLARRDDVRGGLALCLGGVTKYATGALVPLAIVLGRWRLILWALVPTAAVLLATVAVTGAAPFVEYLTHVAPRLNRSHPWDGNQSLQGFLIRVTHEEPLSRPVMLAVHAGQYATLAALLALLAARRRHVRQSLPHLFAAAAALVGWMQIFSPIFWYHYYPYLFPFWGWLAWVAARGRGRATAVAVIVLLAIWPLCVTPRFRLPEPLDSHMLWSTVLLFGLAVAELLGSELERVPSHDHRAVLTDVQQ